MRALCSLPAPGRPLASHPGAGPQAHPGHCLLPSCGLIPPVRREMVSGTRACIASCVKGPFDALICPYPFRRTMTPCQSRLELGGCAQGPPPPFGKEVGDFPLFLTAIIVDLIRPFFFFPFGKSSHELGAL